MNIQEIGEGKGELPDYSDMYCLLVSLTKEKKVPCWYKKEYDTYIKDLTGEEALRADWRIYHPKEEIRPKEAGELWRHNATEGFFHTDHSVQDASLILIGYNGAGSARDSDITHGEHWTRLHPPVPDDNVEEIVIEGVMWFKNEEGVIIPYEETDGFNWKSLLNEPPMTMKLIPKEK